MRLAGALLVLAACGVPSENPPLTKIATVEGQVLPPPGVGGAAWLFLYRPADVQPAVPQFITAVSAQRLGQNPHYVFGEVRPNPWQLFGLLDVNGNFDPNVDVLSQATAGDRVGDGLQVNVQPGRGLTVDYEVRTLVRWEPPAFHLQGATGDVSLDLTSAMTPLTLVADSVGRFDVNKSGFHVSLVDANRDGQPDLGADGVTPSLSLSVLLRWHPRPGQAPAGTNVVVPLTFNPAPFLSALSGRLGTDLAVETIQVFPVPTAQEITVDRAGVQHTATYGNPPFGDYELVVITTGGQFWRLPNQLGDSVPSQAVRLHFDRAAP